MIEADKMLHLRKCMAFLRIGAKSRVARLHLSLRESANLQPYKGYVSRFVHYSTVQTHLRPETYATRCIRMFSSTVPQSSVDDIDHKVMSLCDDIKQGRVSAESLKEIIRLCHECKYQLPPSAGILLLKSCGNQLYDLKPTDRQYLVDQVWQLAKNNNEELTLDHYNTLLNVYAENSTSVDPKNFLDSMTVEPNERTYHLLLNVAAKTGNMNHLQDIMSIIKEKNITLDEGTLTKLVQTYAINGKTAEAEYIITLMQDMGLSLDKVHTELACGYAKLGDVPKLVKILNDESQSNANLLRILKVLSTSDNSRHIPVVLNYLMGSLPEIQSEISKLIAELIRLNRAADGHAIINCIAMNDATKDTVNSFVNNFLNELIIANAPIDDIARYASDFVESGCEPYALINTAEIGLKLGRTNLCLAIFQTMRNKNMEIRPHYYWPLLTIVQKEGEAKVYALVKSMYNEGVELDFDTMCDYVYPFVNTADPIVTLRRLYSYNIPGSVTAAPLVAFLLLQNRVREALLVCKNSKVKIYYRELMKSLVSAYFATRDTKNCVAILTMSPQSREFITFFLKMLLKDEHSEFFVEDMECILKEFISQNGKISQRDATILKNTLLTRYVNVAQETDLFRLIDNMVDENLENSAFTYILQPRHMTTKELYYHLIELNSKNLNTRTVLRKLMEAYLYERDMKKFEEIKREFDARQYDWTPGLKIILFEWYTRCNKLKEAETTLSDLSASDIRIDNSKILLYAIALIQEGNFNKAYETIKNINNVIIRNDSPKYCKKLLDALACSQHHSRIEDMLTMLVKKKYCDFSTEMLRPIVALSLGRNDLLDAIKVFMTCYDKYRRTPLASEILKELLRQNNDWSKKYVETVYEAVVNVQGLGSANMSVAIALAILNKTQELQTVLQNDNQPFDMKTVRHFFAYTQRKEDMSALLTILKVAPNNHILNLVEICELILSFYSKTGQVNDALELWKIIYTKDIKPSKQFRVNFSQFLLSNKVSLPPEFEQDNDEVNVSNVGNLIQ